MEDIFTEDILINLRLLFNVFHLTLLTSIFSCDNRCQKGYLMRFGQKMEKVVAINFLYCFSEYA